MKAFDIGLSALTAQQQKLSVLGNNLANASTPGYHRQRVELVNRFPLQNDKLHIGSGVTVKQISRMRSSAIETALLRNTSEMTASQETLAMAKQLESMLNPGDSTVHATLSKFFNRLEKVSNSPQDLTVRQEFLSAASELMDSFNSLTNQMSDLGDDIRQNLDDSVKQVNQLLVDVADLNSRIFQARLTSHEPNDLLDRRDQLMTKLAEYLDVDTRTLEGGEEMASVAGGAVIVGATPVAFSVVEDRTGKVGIAAGGLTSSITLHTGKILAMSKMLNETLPEFKDRLRELSRTIVQSVDQQHAQGMSSQGPYSVLLGTRGVSEVTLPLARSSPEFPIRSGDLYITVSEDATGNRRTEKITIDSATDSLNDVATKLSALNGVLATVDPVRKTLLISAGGPYSIDFSGRPDNTPDVSLMTGTSKPTFGGLYTGDTNNRWTVTFSGPGEIGVTDGLVATVKDSLGQIIAAKDVGKGYSPGSSFEVHDGVSLSLGSGTIVVADSISVAVVATPDETGLLSAMGINSLFSGSEPGLFQVRSELRQHPERLASSITGKPGEAFNVVAMAGLRDIRLPNLGGRTFIEEMADLTSQSGLVVQAADSQTTQLQAFQTQLEGDRSSVSGVDVSQEMLEMMQTQRAYQAAARFLSTADQMLAELFQLAR